MKLLKDYGEFELIKHLRKVSAKAKGSLKVSIGDDCAVISEQQGKVFLATTDMMTEDVHFTGKLPAFKVGAKALLSSVSDIVSMGGKPLYALVSVGLRKKTPLRYALELYNGINKTAGKYGVKIIGGDTVSAACNIVSITVLGEAPTKKYSLRSGAKENDFILVTGNLGEGAAHLLKKDIYLPKLHTNFALRAVQNGLINGMIDVSDGLSSEVNHLCKESGLGGFIDIKAIPLSAGTVKVARQKKKDPYALALNGGEDYELLFTVNPKNLKILKSFARRLAVKVSVLGVMRARKHGVKIAGFDGQLTKLNRKGYDHFA